MAIYGYKPENNRIYPLHAAIDKELKTLPT